MLEIAERTAEAAGYAPIRLYADETMTESIQLYARSGYVETNRADEKGLRLVQMVKTLG